MCFGSLVPTGDTTPAAGLACLVWACCLMLSATMAGAGPAEVFDRYAQRYPKMAIGLAWSVDGNRPGLLVAGKTHDDGVAVRPDSLWHIGSITKSFTAALAMTMAEAGEIDARAPLGVTLGIEGMDPSWRNVSLEPALSHSAGVPPGFDRPMSEGTTADDTTEERLSRLRSMWSTPLEMAPGRLAYSNVGYVYVGAALEQASGTPWEDLLQSRILDPAGLASAGFGPPKGPFDPWGHRDGWIWSRAIDPSRGDADNPAWLGPAGTLHMTLEDLHRWAETLRRACVGEPSAISQTTCTAMTTPVADGYGLGLIIQTLASGNHFIWHNGSNTLWYAVMGFSPELGVSIAVTVNHPRAQVADRLLRDVLTEITGTPQE